MGGDRGTRAPTHDRRVAPGREEAEDLVQETLLRAWRARAGFQGRARFRTWLYRIATNACLSALKRSPGRVLVAAVPAGDPRAVLPPRQRAVLILRDVLGWPAKETASMLELSVASVNSALQRARSTMRRRLPARRLDWAAAVGPTDAERVVLQRFMDAHDRADVAAFTALLTEDARQAMPPYLWWYEGRDAVATIFARYIDPGSPDYPGHLRLVPTAANRQPAAAGYLRRPGDTEYRLFGLDVLEVQDGLVAGIVSFGVDLLAAFGLPQTL